MRKRPEITPGRFSFIIKCKQILFLFRFVYNINKKGTHEYEIMYDLRNVRELLLGRFLLYKLQPNLILISV